jgi:hypothetical protein
MRDHASLVKLQVQSLTNGTGPSPSVTEQEALITYSDCSAVKVSIDQAGANSAKIRLNSDIFRIFIRAKGTKLIRFVVMISRKSRIWKMSLLPSSGVRNAGSFCDKVGDRLQSQDDQAGRVCKLTFTSPFNRGSRPWWQFKDDDVGQKSWAPEII